MRRYIQVGVVCIIAILSWLTIFYANRYKDTLPYKERYNDIAYQNDIYKQNIAIVKRTNVKLNDAIRISKIDSTKLSNEYQRRIADIMDKAKKQNIRPKDIQSASSVEVVAKDTFYIPTKPSRPIDTTIVQKHFAITVKQEQKGLMVYPKYKAKTYTTLVVRAKYNKKGKPHWFFPRSKLIWGTEYISNFYVDDTTANITNAFTVDFE